jgi:hypothetical protein
MIQFSKHIKKLATYDFFCCYNNGTIWIEISMLKVWPWNLFHITVKYYFRHLLDSLDFVNSVEKQWHPLFIVATSGSVNINQIIHKAKTEF